MEKVVRKYKCSHCNLLSERKFNLRIHYGRAHKDVPVGFKSGNLKVVNVPREGMTSQTLLILMKRVEFRYIFFTSKILGRG